MLHSNNQIKVYFFIGPEKTGTTTIFDMLPFLKPPRQKETFNLSRRNAVNAEWIRIRRQAEDQSQVFIVEPTYFISDTARSAIAEMQSRYEVHVIQTRRDPVSRTVSHYMHHKLKGRVKNPSEAVKAYPEIIEASRYDHYSAKWQAVIQNFHIFDIAEQDLRQALKDIGITNVNSTTANSNRQLSPRNIWLSKVSTRIWKSMVTLRLNLLVPRSAKSFLKNIVYYGGKRMTISDQEREYLTRCLSTTP